MTTPPDTIEVTGYIRKPDGTPSTDVTLTFYPAIELAGSWAADAVIVEEYTVTPDATGYMDFKLLAGAYYRLVIAAPGQRPQRYTVATPILLEAGTTLDLEYMITVGRYGWGPPGNMPLPGWGWPGWI